MVFFVLLNNLIQFRRRSLSGSKQSVPAMHPYRRAFQLRQLTEGNEEFEQKLAKATKYGVLLRESRVW
jgi:hypothetical protein